MRPTPFTAGGATPTPFPFRISTGFGVRRALLAPQRPSMASCRTVQYRGFKHHSAAATPAADDRGGNLQCRRGAGRTREHSVGQKLPPGLRRLRRRSAPQLRQRSHPASRLSPVSGAAFEHLNVCHRCLPLRESCRSSTPHPHTDGRTDGSPAPTTLMSPTREAISGASRRPGIRRTQSRRHCSAASVSVPKRYAPAPNTFQSAARTSRWSQALNETNLVPTRRTARGAVRWRMLASITEISSACSVGCTL